MQFPYGVTFYPELWTRSEINEAFAVIKKSGLEVIRFGEVSWGEIEPKDGKFDFRIFDYAFKLAGKLGLTIVLGLGVSQAPQWLLTKHPEFRPIGSDGSLHPEYGPRPNVCRDNPRFKKYVKRYLDKVVRRYARNKALAMWQIDNEPTYPPLDLTRSDVDFCHCKETRKSFASWLKSRYPSLQKLNEALGTSFWSGRFSSFSDIPTPKGGFWDAGNPHLYLEWYRFKSVQLSNWLKWLKKLVKSKDEKHPIGTNNFVGICCRTPDNFKLAEGMDYYGWDIYPKGTLNSPESLAEHADHWRGICDANNAQFILSELQGGRNVRWGYGGRVRGEEIRTWAHQVVAHGAKGILYHALRPPLFGSETGGFGILGIGGEETDKLAKIKTTSSELKKVWSKLEGAKLKAKVAIVYLKSSEVQAYQEEGPPRPVPPKWIGGRADLGLMYGLDGLAGAYRLLWNSHQPVDFIFEPNLARDIFSYDVILLPNPYVLEASSAQALAKFVRRGGVLITEARFGMKDELAHLRTKPYLEALFSVKYLDTETLENDLKLKKHGGSITGFRDLVETGQGVVDLFEDGQPALIVKKIGRGTIVYACFSLFPNLIKHENRKLITTLRKYLPAPDYKIQTQGEVEVIPWQGKSLFLYVINHSDQRAKVKISLEKGAKKARDVLSDFSCEIKQGTLQLPLMSREVKLLEVK